MTSATSNKTTVESIYAAFGRGDVPTILAALEDDVIWETGGTDHGIPWLVPGRGKEHVGGFFQALTELEFSVFEPHTILDSGDTVVTLLRVEAKYGPTGKLLSDPNEVHVFEFGESGKVRSFRHVVDTIKHREVTLS